MQNETTIHLVYPPKHDIMEQRSVIPEVPAKIQLVEKRETRTSRGMLSKGWYRVDDQIVMAKGNSITEVGTAGYEPYSEVMASLIAQVLGLPHVEYALMPAKLFPDIQTYSCIVERKKSICDPSVPEIPSALPESRHGVIKWPI